MTFIILHQKSPLKMSKKLLSNKCFDRISSLPDPIRAHILSYLPTIDAIKTCILSNTWRALWTQIPSLDLRPKILPYSPSLTEDTIVRQRELFYEFLDRGFESILMLEKLQLYLPTNWSKLKCRVDNWVVRGFGFPLVEFKFEIGSDWGNFLYCLPKCVFSSSLLTTLTLVNCEVEVDLSDIHLPVLCNLCLVSVYITNEAMLSLVAKCPSLESLVIETCNWLDELKISGLSKLKKAEIKYVSSFPFAIFIEAPSLVEFTYECVYVGDDQGLCELKLINCSNVKRFVSLHNALDDYDLHSLLRGLPLLERLELNDYDCLQSIQISSPNLVHLDLVHCLSLRKAELNTPNLKVFCYCGNCLVSLPLRGPTLWLQKATVLLYPAINEKDYALLVQFFAKLRYCERLKLIVRSEKDLMVPQKLWTEMLSPLSEVKHILVELRALSMEHTLKSFLESLLWLAPCPETISISNGNIPVFMSLKFAYEKPSKYQEKCGCWRHSLTKLSIENIRGAEDDTELVNFFRHSRIDGKTVDCSYKTFVPQLKKCQSSWIDTDSFDDSSDDSSDFV